MINLLYACNDNYVHQTIISMISALKHNNGIKFYLVADDISEDNRQLITNRLQYYDAQVEMLELQSYITQMNLNISGRHPKTIYAKLVIAECIQAERILYLDSDTVVMGSLQELWERDMSEEYAAGVLMPYSSKIKAKSDLGEKSLYICDGVVLINLDKWRKDRITEKCLAYISKADGSPYMMSEGTINAVCEGYIGVLAPQYNLMSSMIVYSAEEIVKLFQCTSTYYNEQSLEAARDNPIIIHFLNELYNRPWYKPCDHPYKNAYLELARKEFPECAPEFHPMSFKTRGTRWLRRVLPFSLFVYLYQMKNRKDF